MALSSVLLVTFPSVLLVVLLLLIMTVTIVVLLAHTQGNLLDTLASDSNASRTVTTLIRSSQDQVTLVSISVPGFDPSGTVL